MNTKLRKLMFGSYVVSLHMSQTIAYFARCSFDENTFIIYQNELALCALMFNQHSRACTGQAMRGLPLYCIATMSIDLTHFFLVGAEVLLSSGVIRGTNTKSQFLETFSADCESFAKNESGNFFSKFPTKENLLKKLGSGLKLV